MERFLSCKNELLESYLKFIWNNACIVLQKTTNVSKNPVKKRKIKSYLLKFALKFQGKLQMAFEVWFEISM